MRNTNKIRVLKVCDSSLKLGVGVGGDGERQVDIYTSSKYM